MNPLVLSLALLLPGADADGPESKTVAKLNAYRKTAGLPEVTLDDGFSKPCAAHAGYLIENIEGVRKGKVNVHDEDKDLPGFTPEGQKAAKMSVISFASGSKDQTMGLDLWMGSFFHRIPLLDPTLTKVGVGYASKGRDAFMVLDPRSGKGRNKEPRAIVYPVDGHKDVPCVFSLGAPEAPNPIPDNGDPKKTGQPITVTFFQDREPVIRDATATLTDASGKEVEHWLTWPEKPAVKGFGRDTICLLPKAVLKPDTTYKVVVKAKVDGKDWTKSWSFRTGKK